MFTSDQYELLDFGDGRKLERFGSYVIDRPAAAAESRRRLSDSEWAAADARFEARRVAQGVWSPPGLLESWSIAHPGFNLQLRLTPSGQVGVFPEQAEQWDWIARQIAAAVRPMRVLNLFGYTGASTLVAAGVKSDLYHVDASWSAVKWARTNANRSGLTDRAIHWIVEDAATYVARQIRRGTQYDAIVLDPPSYGHGPRGQSWKLESDLPRLLLKCFQLLTDQPGFLLLTCHTVGWTAERIAEMIDRLVSGGKLEFGEMAVARRVGGRLPSGVFARWTKPGTSSQHRSKLNEFRS